MVSTSGLPLQPTWPPFNTCASDPYGAEIGETQSVSPTDSVEANSDPCVSAYVRSGEKKKKKDKGKTQNPSRTRSGRQASTFRSFGAKTLSAKAGNQPTRELLPAECTALFFPRFRAGTRPRAPRTRRSRIVERATHPPLAAALQRSHDTQQGEGGAGGESAQNGTRTPSCSRVACTRAGGTQVGTTSRPGSMLTGLALARK